MANYRAIAVKAARQYGIPVQPFLAQLNQESGFRPGLTSSAGARWIGQFIPSTARAYGVHDDVSSIYGAAHYMSDLLHRYGSLPRALSAYNSGRPDAYLDPAFAKGQTFNYVRSILGASGVAAAGSAPGSQPPAVRSSPAAAATTPSPPAPAGIPQQVQDILNRNNQTIGLPSMNYGPPPGQVGQVGQVGHSGPKVEVDHNRPVSPNAPGIVKLAQRYLGTPYKWGGTTPKGFDCSGFVQYLYAQKGIQVPRTTYEQFKAGTPVTRRNLQPGDVVFFEPTAKGPGHEGMYIGHGQFIQAPHTGDVVKISRLQDYMGSYVGARRLG